MSRQKGDIMKISEFAVANGWKSKKEKPSKSGVYATATKDFGVICMDMPYSEKHNMFGVTDNMSTEEVEEYLSFPIVKKSLLDDSGWWKPRQTAD